MLTKNQIVPLEITGASFDGKGIGRYQNQVIFVTGAVKGDTVEAHILKVAKSHAFAKVHQIVSPSPDRISSDCSVSSQCGGCAFRHIRYDAELQIKWQRVADALSRIAKLPVLPEPIVGMDETEGYRNKAQYPVRREGDRLLIGFYASHSHRVVNCRNCRLQPPVFEKVLMIFEQWIQKFKIPVYQEETHTGILRHIYIRQAASSGDLMVCPVINGKALPHQKELIEALTTLEEVKSICLNQNRKQTNVILGPECVTLWGKDYLIDTLCSLQFRISPLSFYQVNRAGAEKLYQLAAEYAALTGTETLLDLYCGAGTIGLTMANRARQLIGVEIVPAAIEDANFNASLNGIVNARFLCADASGAAKQLAREGIRPDVVIVDPPRKGCSTDVIETIVEMHPDRVVYVSCDPETLARDLAFFYQLGYAVKKVTPVDLFPRTSSVECCCLLVPR